MGVDVWPICFEFGLAKDFLQQWVAFYITCQICWLSSASTFPQVSLHFTFPFCVFGLSSIQMTGAWGRGTDNTLVGDKKIFVYMYFYLQI